jgi:hypothetical protein
MFFLLFCFVKEPRDSPTAFSTQRPGSGWATAVPLSKTEPEINGNVPLCEDLFEAWSWCTWRLIIYFIPHRKHFGFPNWNLAFQPVNVVHYDNCTGHTRCGQTGRTLLQECSPYSYCGVVKGSVRPKIGNVELYANGKLSPEYYFIILTAVIVVRGVCCRGTFRP